MTDHYPDEFDDDDRMLRDSLAPLRDLKPVHDLKVSPTPAETMTDGEGLHASDSARLRRLLSIAASLLIGTAIGWTMRGPHVETTAPLPSKGAKVIAATVRLPARSTASVEYDPSSEDRPAYFTDELYLCGVGVVQSTSHYQFAKENR